MNTSPVRRLEGASLWLVRGLWLLLVGGSLLLFVLSVPLGYEIYQQPCAGENCFIDQLQPEGLAALEALGLTPRFYAVWSVVLAVASVLVTSGVAFVIAWRRWREPVALFVSLTLVILGIFINTFIEVIDALGLPWALAVDVGQALQWVLFSILFYIFPDGRLIPRWAWLPLIGWVYTQAMYFVGYIDRSLVVLNPGNWPGEAQLVFYTALLLTLLYAQAHRFRRHSTPLQRQQTKWVVFGLGCAVVVLIVGGGLAPALYPAMLIPGTLGDLLYDLIGFAVLVLIPVTFGISILRYRLWDIDLLIRRTLTYTLVTAALAAAYVVTVLALQFAFATLLGQASSTLVSVLSTLAIAALFSPVRRRAQGFIDRRFYRRKYDAAQALASLGASARDDVDLTGLTERLVQVVDETMQPAHISLWVKGAGDEGASGRNASFG